MLKKTESAFKQIIVRVALLLRPPGSNNTLDMDRIQKILIVRQDNRIGNQVFLLPLLKLIKDRYPNSRLDLVVGGSYPRLLTECAPVDRTHCYDQLKFIRRPWLFLRFLHDLRQCRYDVVLDAKRAFSFNNFLLTLICGATVRVGFKADTGSRLYDHEIDSGEAILYEPDHLARLFRYFATVDSVLRPALSLPDAQLIRARNLLKSSGIKQRDTIIGLHPGGRGSKQWPVSHMQVVASLLEQSGQCKVLVFLGPDEKNLKSCFKESQNLFVILPENEVVLAALVKCCKRMVCSDTGVLHLSAALGVDTVSIFISSSPKRYAPQGVGHTVFDISAGQGLAPETVAQAALS